MLFLSSCQAYHAIGHRPRPRGYVSLMSWILDSRQVMTSAVHFAWVHFIVSNSVCWHSYYLPEGPTISIDIPIPCAGLFGGQAWRSKNPNRTPQLHDFKLWQVLSEHLDTIMNAQVPRDTVDQARHAWSILNTRHERNVWQSWHACMHNGSCRWSTIPWRSRWEKETPCQLRQTSARNRHLLQGFR